MIKCFIIPCILYRVSSVLVGLIVEGEFMDGFVYEIGDSICIHRTKIGHSCRLISSSLPCYFFATRPSSNPSIQPIHPSSSPTQHSKLQQNPQTKHPSPKLPLYSSFVMAYDGRPGTSVILVESTFWLVKAHVPMSIFFTGPRGSMGKSKMSIGRPRVMQAFGI